MALDGSLLLRSWLAPSDRCCLHLKTTPAWSQLVNHYSGKPWATRLDGTNLVTIDGGSWPVQSVDRAWRTRFGNRWLIFADGAATSLEPMVGQLDRLGGNGYQVLEAKGIHILDESSRAALTGGSFAETRLQQRADRLTVIKTIKLNGEGTDAEGKLRRECEYLLDLPSNATKLFISVEEIYQGNGAFGYESRFEHAYTLAERLFQGSITRVEAVTGLQDMLLRLQAHVYSRPHVQGRFACQESDVLARLRRRNRLLLHQDGNWAELWHRLLQSQTVVINGKMYLGWPVLDQWIDTAVEPLGLAMPPREMCHGDLIFDDILVPPDGQPWRLLDPNGDASSRIYDLGKLTLSLMSGYEFFKYNRYHCGLDANEGSFPSITLCCDDSLGFSEYSALAYHFPSILEHSKLLSKFPRIGGTTLLFLNGLHNASLPYFHLVHHNDLRRALSFWAIAIIRLNHAKAVLDSGAELSLQAAVDMCLERHFV